MSCKNEDCICQPGYKVNAGSYYDQKFKKGDIVRQKSDGSIGVVEHVYTGIVTSPSPFAYFIKFYWGKDKSLHSGKLVFEHQIELYNSKFKVGDEVIGVVNNNKGYIGTITKIEFHPSGTIYRADFNKGSPNSLFFISREYEIELYKKPNPLEKFNDLDLMDELRKRGWAGNLSKTEK